MAEITPEQQARIAEVSRLKDLPYDGVAGTPPDWFPPKDRIEFLRIRSSLLRGYSGHHILLMIQHLNDMDSPLVPPEEVECEGGYVYIPRRLRPDVWRLLEYKRASDLGRDRGLDLLLGEVIAGDARAARRGRGVLEGNRKGGAKGAATRREGAKPEHERVIRKANLMLKTNGQRRGLAGRIKKSGDPYSTRQINNILNSEMK